MPSRFDAIVGTKKEKPAGEAVDGIFSCLVCSLTDGEAMLYLEEKVVRWTCRIGHDNEVDVEIE
jgi:hypothetical protein